MEYTSPATDPRAWSSRQRTTRRGNAGLARQQERLAWQKQRHAQLSATLAPWEADLARRRDMVASIKREIAFQQAGGAPAREQGRPPVTLSTLRPWLAEQEASVRRAERKVAALKRNRDKHGRRIGAGARRVAAAAAVAATRR